MSSLNLFDEVRRVADPLIAAGATPEQVRATVEKELGVRMGVGGRGSYDVPSCPYCGAYGGGGHGGLCPGAGGVVYVAPPQSTGGTGSANSGGNVGGGGSGGSGGTSSVTCTGGFALPPLMAGSE